MKVKATARMDKPERAKRIMKVASRKQKGRLLQQWVVKQIMTTFDLPDDDVQSTSMGASGVDIKLSAKAKEVFPFAVECKSQQGFTNVYRAMDQAQANKGNETPIVVIKGNYREPVVVIDFKKFMDLVYCQKN